MDDDKQVLQYELTFQDVIKILQLADQTTFRELEIELDGLKVRLETGRDAAPRTPSALPIERELRPDPPDRDRIPAVAAAVGVAESVNVQPEAVDGVAVRSLTGGIFYRAPGPGEPPYAEVGKAVNAGDTLGLIELMKLFTPVSAPVAGSVSEIRAKNEEAVTAGQVLVVITPDSEQGRQ